MSDARGPSPAQVRARLLARLNHELRAPLARIVSQADAMADGAAMAASARRQLAWLADLLACARCEVQAPELAAAPTYLHALLQARGVQYDAGALAPLAVLDGHLLDTVLAQLACQGPLLLHACADGATQTLAFHGGGPAQGAWHDVAMSLDHDTIEPGLMLAAHRVAAQGGRLEQAGAAWRFTLSAPLAGEDDAMPPLLRGLTTPSFGAGCSVLLREPHEAMRAYLAEIFDSAGFSVHEEPATLDGATPQLVVCASVALAAEAASYWPAPQLLHVLAPLPAMSAVLYKPAPPQQLLAAARQLLQR